MKKVVVMLLTMVLVLSFSISAVADDNPFTLHSGVTFGMTKQEVIEKEAENGFECENRELSCFVYDVATAEMEEKTVEGLIVYGSVAGINNSTIQYHFDSEGRLFEAVYCFAQEIEYINYALGSRIVTNGDNYDNYEILKTALQDKYKDAELQTADDDPIVTLINDYTAKLYTQNASVTISEEEVYRIQVSDLDQVYIMHVRPTFSNTVSYGALGYQIQNKIGDYIVYRLVPNEEVLQVNNAKHAKEEQEQMDAIVEEERKMEERRNDL